MPINAVQTISVSGGGSAAATTTTPIRMNQYAVPFNVGFGIYTTGTGDATVHVEHCFDAEVSSGTKWFDHVDVSAGVTVSASSAIDGNYAYPVAHVRMNLIAVSASVATVNLRLLQTGV